MKIIKHFVTIGVFLTTLNSFAASFDCTKAATTVEREICSNKELSALDIKLSETYKSSLHQEAKKELVRSEQRKWLADRNKCMADTICLKNSYNTRINQLSNAQAIPNKQRKKEETELKSASTESSKTTNASNTKKNIPSEVVIPEHMKVESVKKVIKDYLGPCSGSACQINIDLLDKYLKKHEDYSKGKISALVSGPSGSNYVEAYLRNGNQIEVSYYTGTLNSMRKERDTIKIDQNDIIEMYSSALKKYGAEVFEDWYRAPKNGIRALKADIHNYVNLKASAHMNNKESAAADEWNNK